MNWHDINRIGKFMTVIKSTAEYEMERKCCIRQYSNRPNVFEIEFDMETLEERAN